MICMVSQDVRSGGMRELCFNNVLPRCGLHALNLELNEKVDTFFLDLFDFFWISSQIGARVHELGHMAFCRGCPPFLNDPIARLAAT
jgi:hypothetical protein